MTSERSDRLLKSLSTSRLESNKMVAVTCAPSISLFFVLHVAWPEVHDTAKMFAKRFHHRLQPISLSIATGVSMSHHKLCKGHTTRHVSFHQSHYKKQAMQLIGTYKSSQLIFHWGLHWETASMIRVRNSWVMRPETKSINPSRCSTTSVFHALSVEILLTPFAHVSFVKKS